MHFFNSVQYRYGSYGVCLMRGKKFNPKKSPTSPVVDFKMVMNTMGSQSVRKQQQKKHKSSAWIFHSIHFAIFTFQTWVMQFRTWFDHPGMGRPFQLPTNVYLPVSVECEFLPENCRKRFLTHKLLVCLFFLVCLFMHIMFDRSTVHTGY